MKIHRATMPDEEMLTFDRWLRRRRKGLDLTQEQLAERISCSAVTIRKIEAGVRRPSQQIAELLAGALQIAPHEHGLFVRIARMPPGEEQEALLQSLTSSPQLAPAQRPPVAAPQRKATNLPPQLASLIGRARERADIGAYLRREDVRLLTLTGPGGIGKTTLSLRVAHDLVDDFRHGVYFVALAALADPALVLPSIVQTLGVKQSYEGTLIKDLIAYLCDKQILLVLDNFEHLLEAARALGDLLAAAPGLKLLATSRARLNLYKEHIFAIHSLGLVECAPEQRSITVEQALRSDAVKLFVQRGRMVQPDFTLDEKNAASIAEICAALDGIPLAIELAAAGIRLLPPQALRRRLHDRFTLLVAGAADLPTRQQTLRNTLDWSYNLLTQAEQTLFMRLAVFASGCTLDAIINVVADEATRDEAAILGAVESLFDQSLLHQADKDGEPWFSMLETIHAYARERLIESGDAERLQWRCAEYYLQYVESVEVQLSGPDQETYLAALMREHDNLRAVLGWALAAAPEETTRLELALRLCGVLWRLWWTRGYIDEGRHRLKKPLHVCTDQGARGYLDEGRHWLARALATSGCAPAARAKGLYGAGVLAHARGDLATATTLITESLSLWRALDHKPDIGLALNSLGVIHFRQRDYEQALMFFEEGLQLYRELDDTRRVAIALNNLGNIAYKRGDLERAAAFYQEALGLLKDDFTDQETIALITNNLGEIARLRREYVEAARLLHETATIFRKLNNIEGMLLCLNNLVEIAVDQAQAELATRLLGAAEALYERIGAVRSPKQARDYERQVAAVRSQIDDETFSCAWSQGRSIPIEQMITQAIEHIVKVG